jgi:hypothetical protein
VIGSTTQIGLNLGIFLICVSFTFTIADTIQACDAPAIGGGGLGEKLGDGGISNAPAAAAAYVPPVLDAPVDEQKPP